MHIWVFTILLSWIVAADVVTEHKDLIAPNGTPLLQMFNLPELELLYKNTEKRISKRSVRADSSSKSEENVDEKGIDEMHANIKKGRESDLSDEADSSDSGGDRRLSTKGFLPDDFEHESNPNIHERNSKESE